ncbi:MAG: hypothetical protein E7562_00765 [Ruminococcaceae bacterium]|nr:hypothetical protein [Oscillospiraceae bacterium]
MIREIKFTVNENAVTPNARQFAGIAGEHNATQLLFTIEEALLEKIQQQADDSKELKYRFDCFDSCGALYSTESAPFTGETVTLPLGENITRLGGEAKIVLVVTLLNAESKTEMELLSVPVSVYFKGVPFASGKLDESRESLTSLEQSAKKAARNAEESAASATESALAAAASAALMKKGVKVFTGTEVEHSDLYGLLMAIPVEKSHELATANVGDLYLNTETDDTFIITDIRETVITPYPPYLHITFLEISNKSIEKALDKIIEIQNQLIGSVEE